MSWPTSLDVRERAKSLDQIAVGRMTAFSVGDGGSTGRRFPGMIVSANFFDTLRVRAVKGRTFRPEEDSRPGAHPVAVISHTLWMGRFAGDPNLPPRAFKAPRSVCRTICGFRS